MSRRTTYLPDQTSRLALDELRAAVSGRSERIARGAAITELLRRGDPRLVADLERVLHDSDDEPGARALAARALGRIGSPEALDTLRRARSIRAEPVHTVVVAALGAAAPPRPEAIARLPGIDSYEFVRPSPTALAIRATTPEPTQLADALGQVGPQARDVIRGAAVVLDCAGAKFLFLPLVGGETPFAAGPLQAALIAACHGEEVDRWELSYRVLTRPGTEPNRMEILVTTRANEVAFAGGATVDGERVSFDVSAVRRSGVVPVQLAGTFTHGAVHFEHALSAVRAADLRIPHADNAKGNSSRP